MPGCLAGGRGRATTMTAVGAVGGVYYNIIILLYIVLFSRPPICPPLYCGATFVAIRNADSGPGPMVVVPEVTAVPLALATWWPPSPPFP